MKKVLVLVLLFASLSQAIADPVKKTDSMKLTFGWVRGADGKRHSVKNVQFEIGQVIKLDPSQVKKVRFMKSRKKFAPNVEPPPTRSAQPHDLVSLAEMLVGKSLHANAAGGVTFDQTVFSSRTGNFYIL